MTDANYADDLVLLPNTPALAESHTFSREQAAGDISSTESDVSLHRAIAWNAIDRRSIILDI